MGPPADRVVGKDSPHHAQPPSAMEPCRGASAHTSVLRGRRPLASRCRNPYLPSSLPIRTEVELASWQPRPFPLPPPPRTTSTMSRTTTHPTPPPFTPARRA